MKCANGWRLPPKRRPKPPGPLEECLLAIEALHDAAVRFAFAYRVLRLGTVTAEKLLAGGPEHA
ncbi:MAG: hypothetical protein ACREN5_03420 [Gemmatimonadales bacterium]